MRKILTTLIVVLFCLPLLWGQKVNKEFIDGEIYVKLKELKSFSKISRNINIQNELGFLSKSFNLSSLKKAEKPFYTSSSEDLHKIYRINLNRFISDDLLKTLKSLPEIEYVERVPLRYCISTPNDTQAGSQWSLAKINAFNAWDEVSPTTPIKIAVVDNAVQTNHVDLAANMIDGFDLADNDSNPNPIDATFNHGTHVAGIAGAVTNNSLGIASASNNAVRIIPVKATPDTGNPRGIYYGYEGITWAADNGANIISLSWGGFGYSQTEQDVINYAVSKGCMIAAAAGNENSDQEVFPGAYEGVISVASLDNDDKRSSFSSYGTWVDIAAPGRGILSTLPFDTYGSFNGTSMATPLVSAYLGFVWSCFPNLTPQELEKIMKHTTDDISSQNPIFNGQLGAGRINLLKTVACLKQNINDLTISSVGSAYICQGESVELRTQNLGGGIFNWFKNKILTGNNQNSLQVSEEGSYFANFEKANCSIFSDEKKIIFNRTKTPSPTVNNIETAYCSQLSTGLVANPPACNFSGPTTFSYSGGQVGYDAFERSGPDPTAVVENIGGLVSNIKVSITWQKKDQGNENSCGLADGGSVPYNEEVSFKLKSPSGKIITLIASGIYGRGTTSSGVVTTIFQDGANPIAQNSLPQSGTFASKQPLSTFIDDIPVGVWSLLPQDDGFVDPLCVSGFSVIITTNASSAPSQVSWWMEKAGGTLKTMGNSYLPSTNLVGKQKYFVQSRCDGLCPSERVQATFNVKSVPEVVIFPITQNTVSEFQRKNLSSSTQLNYKKNIDGSISVYDESNKNSSEINLGTVSPLTNPITLCSTSLSYLLIAIGCPTSTITWSYGETGQNLIVSPTSTIGYSAYCHQTWQPCEPIISNIVHFITTDHHDYPIVEEVAPNNIQKFVQNYVIASNLINTPANIEYRGMKSVELKPGFQVEGNSVFKAEIKGCEN